MQLHNNNILVHELAHCPQAPSHYMNQCLPSSMPPYGITRPQWVNPLRHGDICLFHCTGSPLVRQWFIAYLALNYHLNQCWHFPYDKSDVSTLIPLSFRFFLHLWWFCWVYEKLIKMWFYANCYLNSHYRWTKLRTISHVAWNLDLSTWSLIYIYIQALK